MLLPTLESLLLPAVSLPHRKSEVCCTLHCCRRSFHAAGVLLPTLDACYSLLLAAAAGGGPFPPAREALLSAACGCVRGVLGCDGYAGRAGSGMGSAAERVSACSVHWTCSVG